MLDYIYLEKEKELTQRELCAKTLLPKQTVNSIVQGFVKKGYICLKESEEDRRSKSILLTPSGRRLCEKVIAGMDRAETAAAMRLKKEEWEALTSCLGKYTAVFTDLMRRL